MGAASMGEIELLRCVCSDLKHSVRAKSGHSPLAAGKQPEVEETSNFR
jgi:hypothetical protein